MITPITPFQYNNTSSRPKEIQRLKPNIHRTNFQGKCNLEKCKAICCYNVPLPKDLLTKFTNKIVNHVYEIKKLPKNKEYKGKYIFPITNIINEKHNKCPFLTITNRCNIYEHRPQLCKDFGTKRNDNLLICPHQD